MRLFSIVAGIFVAIFFIACGDSGAVAQGTSGIVPTHIKPQITFKDNISDKINTIFQAQGEISINNQKYFGKYVFDTPNSLSLLPDEPFLANKSYKINFDFEKINALHNTNITAKNLTMKFDTQSVEAQIERADFIKDANDFSKIKLEAKLHLSQSLPSENIAESVSLVSESGKNIPLNISAINEREILLTSQNLAPDSAKYALNLSKDLGLEKEQNIMLLAANANDLKVISVTPIMGERVSLEVRFSAPLSQNLNLDNFIRVSPNTSFRTAQSNDKIIISGDFALNAKYEIEIIKGIKARDGSALKQNFTQVVEIVDKEPKIVFSSDGVFLPDSARKKIAFKSINVKSATLVVRKIYSNNLTYFLSDNNLMKKTSSYFPLYEFNKIGGVIFEKDIKIDYVKNAWVQSEIDLSALKDLSGMFVVSLHFERNDVDYTFPAGAPSWRINNYFYDNGNIYRELIFSNIALIAQKFNDELIVSALDIKSNESLSNIEITGISESNQVISKALTNKAGNATLKFSDKIAGIGNKQDIAYVSAKSAKGENFALIKLRAQEISDDGFDTNGVVLQNGMKAFIYTDRGVYRPGEVANINIIARQNNVAIKHPIKLSITNPLGKKVLDSQNLAPISDGAFYYAFNSAKSAPTGIYNITINIGDNIFTHKLAIEAVVPDRIKVNINAPDEVILDKENNLKFALQGDYLFGAPAENLEWSANIHFTAKKFAPKKYKEWHFDKFSAESYYESARFNGKLDKNGNVEQTVNVASYASDDNVRAQIIAQVFEKNGRAVTQRKSVDLVAFDSFVGIKKPSTNYIKRGDSVKLDVVLLDKDENFIKNRKLSYKVYQSDYSWWWDYSSKNDFIKSIKGDKRTALIAEGEFKSKNGISQIAFNAKESGETLIEVVDTTNNQSAQILLYASSWGEPLNIDKIMQLKIKSDKNIYENGDLAKVTFESVKGAKALVTISSDKEILNRYWINTKDLQTSFNVAINEKDAPNLYASVFLLQDYNTLDNDRSLRLYGVVPLNIINKSAKIDVEIKAKDEILPDSALEVEISNKQNKQVTYTLAVVDEGLLNLTDFKTPSPYNYFYAKTKYNIRNYDTYDYIIAKIDGAVRNSYSIGGDEESAGAKQKNDENASRFKPVVHFIPPTKSDKNGRAKLSFKIPAYLGALRVMLVAVDENSYGSAQKEVKVSAPAVILPTIPRSLKVGDEFEMPLEVMQVKDSAKSAVVSVKSDGIIKFDKSTQSVDFKKGKSQTLFFKGKVSDELGIEHIAIALKSGDFKMSDTTEIDIKAPNPYTQISKNWAIKNDSVIIEAPQAFIKNSNKGQITLSASPLLSIDHRLRWLVRYPYGCIEQTTSSVFPQLFINKLSNAQFATSQVIVDNINAGIARIQSFQTSDGGFSYWQGGQNSDKWGSSYATHFLIMAKKAGYQVSDSALKRALNYLKNSNEIYALYLLSLSGNHNLGAMNKIYENDLRELTTTNRWLLGAAYKLAGFEDIAKKITAHLSLAPNEDESYYAHSYGSILRNKAMILEAYYTINGSIDAELYNEIKSDLEGDEWLSTQTSAYALLVMANIKADSAENTQIEGEIVINNNKQTLNPTKDKLTFALDSGSAKVSTKNQLFINYSWEGISADSSSDNITKKMELTRDFIVFEGNGTESRITVSELKSGDSFYIKLWLNPHERPYINMDNIALVQNLPSGWEIENTRLNNDTVPPLVRESNSQITYTDIRDDKIMWFFNVSYQQVVYVKINVVTPGLYTLPAAYAEAMYDGSYRASTDSLKVKVVAK